MPAAADPVSPDEARSDLTTQHWEQNRLQWQKSMQIQADNSWGLDALWSH